MISQIVNNDSNSCQSTKSGRLRNGTRDYKADEESGIGLVTVVR